MSEEFNLYFAGRHIGEMAILVKIKTIAVTPKVHIMHEIIVIKFSGGQASSISIRRL